MDDNTASVKKRRKRGKSSVGRRRKRHLPHISVTSPTPTGRTQQNTLEIQSSPTNGSFTTSAKDKKRLQDKIRYESKVRSQLEIEKEQLLHDKNKLSEIVADKEWEIDHTHAQLDNLKQCADKEVEKLKGRIDRHVVTRQSNKSEFDSLKAVLKTKSASIKEEQEVMKRDAAIMKREATKNKKQLKDLNISLVAAKKQSDRDIGKEKANTDDITKQHKKLIRNMQSSHYLECRANQKLITNLQSACDMAVDSQASTLSNQDFVVKQAVRDTKTNERTHFAAMKVKQNRQVDTKIKASECAHSTNIEHVTTLLVHERLGLAEMKSLLDTERRKNLGLESAMKDQLERVESQRQMMQAKIDELQISMSVAQSARASQDLFTAWNLMLSDLEENEPSDIMQDFAHRVLQRCGIAGSHHIDLRWMRLDGSQHAMARYKRIKNTRSLRPQGSERSHKRWLQNQARHFLDELGQLSKMHIGTILQVIAESSGYLAVCHKDLLLSIEQCIALRDHVGTGTNGLYRLKQALEVFLPTLKGLVIPPNIRRSISSMEKQGVVPSRVVEVNCTITRKGNRRGMCTYYYCEHPAQLLANMFRRMFMDGEYEESSSFSSMSNQLAVSIGFDKSDKDFVGTWRPCNRRNGNSGIHVQAFACLEGPVSECYENEIITIGNPAYPTRDTVQHLVDDFMFALVFMAKQGTKQICSCSIFLPIPTPEQLTSRQFDVTYLPEPVSASLVEFDGDNQDDEDGPNESYNSDINGRSPEIVIPLDQSKLCIRLIHDKDIASVMVGYQVLIDEVIISNIRLYHHMSLGVFKPTDIKVTCHQIAGHLSNDNKQISILTGQCSCSVGYPMSCCMVAKKNLGVAPEYIQWRYLQDKIRSTEWAIKCVSIIHMRRVPICCLPLDICPDLRHDKKIQFIATKLPRSILLLIAEYANCPITPDPPKRIGNFSIAKTSERMRHLTADGRLPQTKTEQERDNLLTGSSFKPPIFNFHPFKQNGGAMHGPAGHTTHFNDAIAASIRDKMKSCTWKQKVDGILPAIVDMKNALSEEVGESAAFYESETMKKKLIALRSQITKYINQAAKIESNGDSTTEQLIHAGQLRDTAAKFNEQAEEMREARIAHACVTDYGEYHKILAGLKDLEIAVTECTRQESKRAHSDLEFVYWKALESRAKGKFDPKNSGTEQTNGNGMNSLENFKEVTKAMIGMYPSSHNLHQWLKEESVKWEALAEKLFDVACFLKSQKKRDPTECDNKMYALWSAWEYAFPGRSFNKFHGLFCTIRNFIHKYEMSGRISEESNEAFNGTLAKVKELLRCMPGTVQRVELTSARTQGNLKGELLEEKILIKKSIKGTKRGPQRIRMRDRRHGKIIRSTESVVEFNGKEYVTLSNGNLLPSIWRDIYEWYAGGIAPQSWRDGLAKTCPSTMSEMDKAKEWFSPW